MRCTVDIALSPAAANDPEQVREAAADAAGVVLAQVPCARIVKRSIDARGRQVRLRLRVEVGDEPYTDDEIPALDLPDVSRAAPVIIIGCGPAGLFCALRSIQLGRRPIIVERGKDVRARRRDLAAINKEFVVDPDSNYCFGEGGAGTYSDGKLYTRSSKRGDVAGILRTLVSYGASPDILVDAHPHIGTNKLPGIITAMRESILAAGGEVRFGHRVTDLLVRDGAIRGVQCSDGTELLAEHVVLATGHSARDIFTLLQRKGIRIEAKLFAMGVRIEHPQHIIDRIQYHCDVRDPLLPPASYSLVQQVNDLGVYSFCMCPGGIIAPCATAQDEVVTNGWSPSKRNNPYANSGMVTTVDPANADHRTPGPSPKKRGGIPAELQGMAYQRDVEHAAWIAGGRTQQAPAQRMEDFIGGRASADLPDCSYPPGIVPFRIDQLLPKDVSFRLREALKRSGGTMRGYRTNEAVVVAVESRTSSPVRIPRDPASLQHVEVKGLYPCGEGAGYAGGIVSAAMDGWKVAEALCAVAVSD
ncbi:MAG: FAD-binding protein [Flavobacteriales bacterium]|nr:MAG: FAD-binding protein [Flavobacteriales bacterium]